jgi:hypothetical protein
MANLLFAKELARRFSGTARVANALHPGVIFDTNLQHSMNVPRIVLYVATGLSNLLMLKSIPQGAATQCYVATNPALEAVSGQYFVTASLPSSEFANFAALQATAAQPGPNVVITATDGDTLTLKNMSTPTLAGMSANFTFHS